MSLPIFLLVVWSVEPPVAEPLTAVEDPPSTEIETRLPSDGAAPLAGPLPATESSDLPPGGIDPFDGPPTTPMTRVPTVAAPLGVPVRVTRPQLDRMLARVVRIDLLFGPMWRLHRVDTMIASGMEFGRMHGFSAAFHWAVLIDSQREVVRALDAPIGFGAVARGRLRKHPLFGSVGLTVGMLVHRAKTERGVLHRVDPDFRLPIRFAWTIANVGLSLVIEQGYSVRNRHYERRGVEVWARHAYRVGFALGIHSDIMAGQGAHRRPWLRRSRKRDATR